MTVKQAVLPGDICLSSGVTENETVGTRINQYSANLDSALHTPQSKISDSNTSTVSAIQPRNYSGFRLNH